jgi:hypothetical protein
MKNIGGIVGAAGQVVIAAAQRQFEQFDSRREGHRILRLHIFYGIIKSLRS